MSGHTDGPDVARSSPAMIISSEVLPEPLGPTMATASPDAISMSTPRKISTGPARLASVNETLSREMTGSATWQRLLIFGMSGPEACLKLCKFLRQLRAMGVTKRHPMPTMPSSSASQTWCLPFSSAIGCCWPQRGNAAAAGQPLRIVVFGDSLVAGFQLKASDAFPAQLERALKARGHAVEVINAGVSGDTTAAGLERLRWSIPEKADAVILELGANDALRGLDPDRAKSNLDKMIATIKATGAEVLLAGMLAPPNMGAAYAQAFNAHLPGPRDQARADPVSLLPRRYRSDQRFNLNDGLHPNSKGVAEITKHPADGRAADRAGPRQAGCRHEGLSMPRLFTALEIPRGDAHASVAAARSARRREMDRAREHAHHAALRGRHRRSHGR